MASPSLAEQALAALSPGSPWKSFNAQLFVADMAARCADIDAASARLASFAGVPPLNHAAINAVEEALYPSLVELGATLVEVFGLVPWKPEDGREKLHRYFASRLPDRDLREPAPPELVGPMLLIVFRLVFPSVRRLLICFTSPSNRGAWGAAVPLTKPPQNPLLLLHRTAMFEDAFYRPAEVSIGLVGALGRHCSRVRSRVAGDVGFLQALATFIVAFPNFVALRISSGGLADLGRQAPSAVGPWFDEFRHAIRLSFSTFSMFLYHNPKPWKDYMSEAAKTTTTASLYVFKDITEVLHANPPPEAWDGMDKMSAGLLAYLTQIQRAVAWSVNSPGFNSDFDPDAAKRWLKSGRDEYIVPLDSSNFPDGCDWCDCSLEGPGLGGGKRCSKCRTARYCSPECQKASWTTARKFGDAEGRIVEARPHKAVCVDSTIWY